MNKIIFTILSIFLLFAFAGCGVNKKGKQRMLSRVYHNTTARYNAYFNSTEIVRNYELQTREKHVDDYYTFLPVNYLTPKDSSQKSTFEPVLGKLQKVVSKHEASKWTDDSYLVLGISQYYSGEFEEAVNTFRHVIENYDPITLESKTYYPNNFSKREQREREKIARDQERKEAVKQREQEQKDRQKEIEEKRKQRAKEVKDRNKKGSSSKTRTEVAKRDIDEVVEEREKRAELAEAEEKARELSTKDRIKARKQEIKEREKEAKRLAKLSAKDKNEEAVAEKEIQKEESTLDKIDNVIAEEVIATETASADGDIIDGEIIDFPIRSTGLFYFDNPYALEKYAVVDPGVEVEEGVLDIHNPAYYEAILWMAKSKIALKEYYAADVYLRKLFKLANVEKSTIEEGFTAVADLYFQRGDYATTLRAIDKSIESGSINDFEKSRLSFLKGQIFEDLTNYSAAINAYDEVSKFRPKYYHELKSNLNSLRLQSKISDDYQGIERELKRMSKDDKNREYFDIIFFELAQLYLKLGQNEEAIAAFQCSVNNNQGNNPKEKAIAYSILSDLHLDKEDFIDAYYYADSAYAVDDKLVVYQDRSNQLEKIAKSFQNIEEKDSLLMISLLPEKEKLKLAKELKKQMIDKEIRSQVAEQRALNEDVAQVTNLNTRNNNQKSNFFAYNDSNLKSGLKKFRKDFKNRPYSDNWKYASLLGLNEDGELANADDANSFGISQVEFEEIFEGVPQTDEEREDMRLSIAQSYLDLGVSFREDYVHLLYSLQYLDSVFVREPEDEMEKTALHTQYLDLVDLGRTAEAETVLKKLKSSHPDFELEEKEELNEKVLDSFQVFINNLYNQTYRSYEGGDFRAVNTSADLALDTLQENHFLYPKFELLRAMSIGGLGEKSNYIAALTALISKYKATSEVGKRAKEIIDIIGLTTEEKTESEIFDSQVEFDRHYLLVKVDDSNDLFENRKLIGEFNEKYFASDNLALTVTRLGNKVVDEEGNESNEVSSAILIRLFKDQKSIMDYYNKAKSDLKAFCSTPEKISFILITQSNYRKLFQNSNLTEYLQFQEDLYF